MKGHSESAYFAKLDLQTEWLTWLWQRSRTQSIGPNDSNERWQWIDYYLASILLQLQKICDLDLWFLTLTFDVDIWPWPLTLRLISCSCQYWLKKVSDFLDFFLTILERIIHFISVLYQIQSDMSTNSREIKYQNIEKSLSLIIEWLVSRATQKIRRFDFHDKFLPWFSDQNAPAVKKSGRSDQYWGLYIVQLRTNGDRQTNRGDQYTLQKSTILQSNKPRWPIYFAKIYDFAK